ncbi:hypothetical protein DNU06_17140 [Putridiphycobacter roseus]|uniref:Lipoprotein n=1 Tax=Putridiphycobacter roseus TaxID=2219161 RepID=A0A2W1MUY4_9FLAO|nr:hypothetical protein [Putridiphycobacter roseus]PZE15617.1 hypothetical protein DNU06_17140 [Putridiphycobacter roseus]
MKITALNISIVCIISLFFSCNSIPTNQTEQLESNTIQADSITKKENTLTYEYTNDSIKLSNAIDSIWDCEGVQYLEKKIIRQSSKKRHLTIIPFKNEFNITVKLMEDNGFNYVTHLSFIITPKENWKIEYHNTIENKFIAFDVWNANIEKEHDINKLRNNIAIVLSERKKELNEKLRYKYNLKKYVYTVDGSYMGLVYFYGLHQFKIDSAAIVNS